MRYIDRTRATTTNIAALLTAQLYREEVVPKCKLTGQNLANLSVDSAKAARHGKNRTPFHHLIADHTSGSLNIVFDQKSTQFQFA